MSIFWTIWISVITLGSIAGCYWLLKSNSVTERQPGEEVPTTGHSYDGIQEYDNPMPRWWYIKFMVTLVFGLCYLALYPGLGNWGGFLGWTQQKQWEAEIAKADEKYGELFASYSAQSIEALQGNPSALRSGARIFSNNCAVCHGSTATGSYGFPNLTDNDWIWGGSTEAIETTILHGRQGAMPAWKAVIGTQGVDQVAEYVLNLAGREADEELAAAGKAQFEIVCAACHGADGKGMEAVGAPDLTDDTWLYGGSPELIKHTIREGRNGVMPAWSEILGEDQVHLVAAYIYSLSH